MKKIGFILALVIALGVAGAVQAGPATFGLKGGLTFAKLTGDVENVKNKTGFMIGGFAEIGMGGFAIQPEIFYVQKGAKEDAPDASGELKYDVIEIPVLFKYNVVGPGARPYFVLGPSLSFNMTAEFEEDGMTEDISDFLKSSDFGFVFGLGVNIQKLLLEARYNLGLSDINDDPDFPGSAKTSTMALLGGITF